MKKFTFSLETLLKERILEVEKTQKEMALIVNKFNRVQSEKNKVTQVLSGRFTSGLSVSQDYFKQLGEIYQLLRIEKKEIEEELKRWQEILAQKIKNQRIIEILKEKRYQEWKKSFNKKVERNNEELVLNFF